MARSRIRTRIRIRTRALPVTGRALALGLGGGTLALGLGSLYLTGLVVDGGDIADGTRVRGVDIGGLSRAEARQELDRRLGPAFAAPVAMTIGSRTEQAGPASLGLSFDTAATVERAASGGSDPVSVIGRLFASDDREIEPVIRMDESKARTALDGIAADADRQARNGSVSFEKGRAEAVAPVTGISLVKDGDGALTALREAYFRADAAAPAVLPVRQTEPGIGAQETARALKEFAEPAMSGPVTLTLAGKRITIAPAVLGEHLKIEAEGGKRLVPALDAKGLLADPAVARPLEQAVPGARDARLGLDGAGRVQVLTEARTGARVTAEALGDAVRPLLTRAGAARTGPLATEAVQPRLTRASAPQLGIREKVSSFTVAFPAAPYRTTNIGRAAELINGSVVLPGEEWSFNRTVGERTKENGFVDGIMINDGRYTKSAGGGVSAVATTMFNAMFFAGVKPVEYGAHSFYIERYPEGREATVAWGTLDLRWVNDSGHALYVQARADDTSVTITLLGTKKYEIQATQGPRTKIKPPEKRNDSGPQCEVQTPLEGFDVTVGRIFLQDGREVKRENFTTHYTPRDEVTCEPEETAAADRTTAPDGTATPEAPVPPAS
ncbi:VanW family protein [Streptomyces sp. NPDC051211]|uniref:VanW family protein n=1 Tax=Streptomyces sp. NPDC051211 TaxID=3154643 RepID=UPI0034502584